MARSGGGEASVSWCFFTAEFDVAQGGSCGRCVCVCVCVCWGRGNWVKKEPEFFSHLVGGRGAGANTV